MKRWKILNQEAKTKNKEEVLDVLLKNRGIIETGEIDKFLNPSLEGITFQNVGIDEKEVSKTVKIIQEVISEDKAIVIYGDYDVDGICGTAIVWETLYSFYKNVHPYIPHRVDEGYGLSEKGIKNLTSEIKNVGLLITIDNGIVARKAVKYAKSLGIKVIITDHHATGEIEPKADAIVHTTQLCGTGVSYLLSQEIIGQMGEQDLLKQDGKNLKTSHSIRNNAHLELVALATIADLVPLNKYNRALVKFGVEKLRQTTRPGLLALFEEAKIDKASIGTYEIGHIIAPRLNASGRITHALDSLRLICTKDAKKAHELAKHLHEVNKERQQLTIDSATDAITKIKESRSEVYNILFVENVGYEQGVIGLIASKLVEEFYRPAIAVSIGGKISKGSARSISGVNIIELIRSIPELTTEAGGHPMAAGFSIETEKLPEFKNALIAKAENLEKHLFEREVKIDMELPWGFIDIELYEILQALAPFGMGNAQPTFLTKGLAIASLQRVGKEGKHLQLLFEKDGDFIKGMRFGDGSSDLRIGDIVDVVYTLELNEWNGKRKVELRIKDIEISQYMAF